MDDEDGEVVVGAIIGASRFRRIDHLLFLFICNYLIHGSYIIRKVCLGNCKGVEMEYMFNNGGIVGFDTCWFMLVGLGWAHT